MFCPKLLAHQGKWKFTPIKVMYLWRPCHLGQWSAWPHPWTRPPISRTPWRQWCPPPRGPSSDFLLLCPSTSCYPARGCLLWPAGAAMAGQHWGPQHRHTWLAAVTCYPVGPRAAPDRMVHEGNLKLVALCLVCWRWDAERVGGKALGAGLYRAKEMEWWRQCNS